MPGFRARSMRRGTVVAWLLGCALLVGPAQAEDEPLPPPRVIKRGGARPRPAPPTPVRPAPAPTPVRPAPTPVRPAPPARPPAPVPIPPQPRADGPLPPPVVRRGGVPIAPRPPVPTAPRPAAPGVVQPPPPGGMAEDIPFIDPGRPETDERIEPGDFLFDVARPGGGISPVPMPEMGKDVVALVIFGTPRMHRTAYTENGEAVESMTLKANHIVAWVDRAKLPAGGNLADLPLSGPAPGAPPATDARRSTSIIPEALLGVYAEGAVEISFGTLSFSAERLYIEPHSYRALLIKPSFDGRSIGIGAVDQPLEAHVKGERARIVSRGLMVFDEASASTSRADDRIWLQLRTLTAEELDEATGDEGVERQEIMGFYADSTQWYTGRRLVFRAERIPLLALPVVSFGQSETTQAFTSPIKDLYAGNKGELGRFAGITLQFPIGPARDPWFVLLPGIVGYSKRGVAGSLGAEWERAFSPDVRTKGEIEAWGIHDNRSFDDDGYVPPDSFRYRIVSESRTWLGKEWIVDHEWSEFSDRGVNNEFFERDDLQHKDRESYLRGRWQPRNPGYLVVTADGKWHQRDFVTETTQLPEVGVWLSGAPLLTPRRRGGLGVDITSETRAGYLGRRFDEALKDTTPSPEDYEAWRLYTDTLVNAAGNLDDLRLSAHVGVSGAAYAGRTDDGNDLGPAALLAGLRANMQFWRVFAARGGWMELDGLRHVIDVDAEVGARFLDSHDPSDVPYFDYHETQRDRTSVVARYRNRLQTRRRSSGREVSTPESGVPIQAPMRTVADLEIGLRWFLDDKGPYGLTSPGDLEVRYYGEIKPGLELAGELDYDFDGGVQVGSISAGWRTTLRERPFSLFAGHRYVKDRSASLTGDASWRFSDRYAVQGRVTYDFDEGEDTVRLLFRRYSDDHVIVFGFNVRNRDDFGVEFSFEPTVGGGSTEGREVFREYPSSDPWGAFRR